MVAYAADILDGWLDGVNLLSVEVVLSAEVDVDNTVEKTTVNIGIWVTGAVKLGAIFTLGVCTA